MNALVAAALALLPACRHAPLREGEAADRFALVYTTRLQGEVEPCG